MPTQSLIVEILAQAHVNLWDADIQKTRLQHTSLYLVTTQDLLWMLAAYKQLQELLKETTISSQLQKGNLHSLTGQSYPFAEYSQVYMGVTE